MNMHDCDVCLSAGSVNKWGICEICGEDFEETASSIDWRKAANGRMQRVETAVAIKTSGTAAAIGQDAA